MKKSSEQEPQAPRSIPEEKPDEWWYKIYAFVVVFTAVVIALLGTFTWYFSG